MRHADISTTAKYGGALMESKRKHNSIVVRRAFGKLIIRREPAAAIRLPRELSKLQDQSYDGLSWVGR
jgi:hypothetical protein